MRVYVSGPMTGIADFNFPAFHSAAATWRRYGHTVINPAETDKGDTSQPRPYYMRKDIEFVLQSEAIAVLPGWQRSKGAQLEVSIGRELLYPIYDAQKPFWAENDFTQKRDESQYRETALDEAKRLVYGDREAVYDHPIKDFTRTAAMWSAFKGFKFSAQDVAAMMVMVKLSRLANSPRHRDSIVDIAGYAECYSRCLEVS